MTKIKTYPYDHNITGDDKVIGTDFNGNPTKNYSINDIGNSLISLKDIITGSGTLNTITMFTPTGRKIGDSIITQDSLGQGVTIAGSTSTIGNATFLSTITADGSTGTTGKVLGSTGTGVEWVDNIAQEAVSGVGTTHTLPVWEDGPNSVLSDSAIREIRGGLGDPVSNVIIATTEAFEPLSVDFASGGTTSFKQGTNEFIKLTDASTGFYTSNFQMRGTLAVGRDQQSTATTLDVGLPTDSRPAAWFRNGVVISNNPSGVQVDNTSMVIGAGNNDNVTGSDHCLIVGSGNQIVDNSDQSVAFGQGNTITQSKDALAVGNSNSLGSSLRTQAFGFNNSITAASSFVAGGGNNITATSNVFSLGDSNAVSGSTQDAYLFGTSNTMTGGTGSFAIGSNLDGDDGNHMIIGYRNDKTSYPATNYSLGLGNTKFALAVGSTTSTNSNAIIITEGGVNRGGSGVAQIPRIILPQQETFEFTSDTDATAGGIPTGGLYRSGNNLKINFNETASGGNEGLAYLTPQLITASAGGSGNIDPNYNLVLLSWTLGNGVYTLNLPSASANQYRLIRITTDGSLASGAGDKIDITATGGDTIDGSATFQISKRYEGLAVYSTGSEWIIVQAKAH